MLEFFLNIDTIATSLITKIFPSNIIFDYIFLFFSFYWLTPLIAIILWMFFWHTESKKTKTFILSFLVSFIAVSIIANILIKNIVQRERPYITYHINVLYCPANYSFPSGHSAIAFAGAILFAYFDKKRKWLYYSVAIMIGISRIYLHCHYAGDVFFGAFLGYLFSKAIILYLTDS
jgi:undecaprenyl-diphosphatase